MGISMHIPAPHPPHEDLRNEVASQSWLFSAVSDRSLASLAKKARLVFRTRWSGVCLIVEDSQHVVASSGGMLGIYRRSTAISSYVVAFPDVPFVVLNALEDERFAGNPFVEDRMIGFYVGAALHVDGYAVGALCVTDPEPRVGVDAAQLAELESLARQIELMRP